MLFLQQKSTTFSHKAGFRSAANYGSALKMLKAIFKLKKIKHEKSHTEIAAFETTPLPFTRMGILRSEIPMAGKQCKIQGKHN